ncbi:unnamed protein product [Phaedon cochleariae]|uniref:Uncharacterized protein n=1 Tax=Phaedon cochleariae TaxID=80249 RepID=A0A9N9SGW1_PHACE|nr:unnamed protein product [Phaedon cochleariae]
MMNMNNVFTRGELIKIQETIKNNKLYKQELNFKIIVIGDYGVGKTSIIRRYTEGEFSTDYRITIGADFAIKTIEWDEGTRINLHVWDIAGHERFGSLLSVFFRHAVAAAIVFDLTRPDTFKSVDKVCYYIYNNYYSTQSCFLQWLIDLRRKIQAPDGQAIPVVILANKGDIIVKTVPQEIDEYCKLNNILAWYITSAKNNMNIDEVMIRLTNAAVKNHYGLQCSLITEEPIRLSDNTLNNTQEGRKCC